MPLGPPCRSVRAGPRHFLLRDLVRRLARAHLPPLLAAALSFACGRSSHPAQAPSDAFPDRAQGFGAKLVVDAGGGRHLAAGTPVGTGPRPVRYGYCAAGCGAASSWAFVSLDELGAAGGSVDLAVDGA